MNASQLSSRKNFNNSENEIFENNSYLQRRNTAPKGELDSPVSVALPSATQASWRPRGPRTKFGPLITESTPQI
jgi:hypothetical protein